MRTYFIQTPVSPAALAEMIRANWGKLTLTIIRNPALNVRGRGLVRKYGYRLTTPEGVILLNDPPRAYDENRRVGFGRAVADLRELLAEAGGVPDAALSWENLARIADYDWDDSRTMGLEEVNFPFANLRDMRAQIQTEDAH